MSRVDLKELRALLAEHNRYGAAVITKLLPEIIVELELGRALHEAAEEVDRAQWKSSPERAHAMANMATVLERCVALRVAR